MMKAIYAFVALIQGLLAASNIILNGDFENHPVFNLTINCPACAYPYYQCLSNNFIDYNWKDGNLIYIQWRSKQFSSVSSTNLIDSCATSQTKLMQDIALQENGYYRITFDMCKNEWENCNYLSVWIGTEQIYSMQKICVNECLSYQKYFRWQKNQNLSIIFLGYNYLYRSQTCVYGPLLDNITLIKLQQINRTISINLKPNKSIASILQITTNITLIEQEPDKLSKLSQQFKQIQINAKIFTKCQFTVSNENKFRILLFLQEDIQIKNLSISINSFVINDTLYNFSPGDIYIEQPLVFLFGVKLNIVDFLNQVNKPVSLRLRDTILVGRFLGIGSIFLDIFAFWQIAIFYHYVGIDTPGFVKYSIQESFNNFLLFGIYKEVSLESFVYPTSNFSMVEKVPATSNQWSWFYEFGYTSNYYKNNLQPFTLIGIGLIRTVLFQIIFNLIGFKLFRMNRKWHNNLAYDIISWIPFLVLVPAIIISSSFINFAEKVNYIIHILTMFFCLLTPTFFLIINFLNLRKRYRKTSIQYMTKKTQTLYIFLEFTFIFCLTFLTGIKQKDLFLVISTSLVITKLAYLIKYRIYFATFDFAMKLFSGVIWLIYTINFILFRVLEILAHKNIINISNNGFWQSCFQNLGISVLMIFTIGGWLYLFNTCINFFCEIKQTILKIKKDCQRKMIKNKVEDIHEIQIKKEKLPKKKKEEKIIKKDNKQEKKSEKNKMEIQQPKNKPQNKPQNEQQNEHQNEIKIFNIQQKIKKFRLNKAENIIKGQKNQQILKPRLILKNKFWKNIQFSNIPQ